MDPRTKHVEGAEITCLCDSNPAQLKACAAEFSIPETKCYTSIKAMLDAEVSE